MKKLSMLADVDKPREKLKKNGAQNLSDLELLMAIVGSGNKQADVREISANIKRLIKKVGIEALTYDNLSNVTGLGAAKVTELLAAVELVQRNSSKDGVVVSSAEDAVALLGDIRDKQQEYFVCLSLDGGNRLIAKRIVTIGTLTASLVHPREVFADPLQDRAASIIVAHNHPSGNLQPSDADRQVTIRLKEAGELFGIQLIDHIVVTKTDFKSLNM